MKNTSYLKIRLFNIILKKGKVLVIDDFHYASPEMQMKMAQQLKDAIRRELKVVVVSLPHRADDAVYWFEYLYFIGRRRENTSRC